MTKWLHSINVYKGFYFHENLYVVKIYFLPQIQNDTVITIVTIVMFLDLVTMDYVVTKDITCIADLIKVQLQTWYNFRANHGWLITKKQQICNDIQNTNK